MPSSTSSKRTDLPLTALSCRESDVPDARTLSGMTDSSADRIAVEFTTAEAKLILAALRQFEPYWPADVDDLNRAQLLAGIREGIEHVVGVLDHADRPTS